MIKDLPRQYARELAIEHVCWARNYMTAADLCRSVGVNTPYYGTGWDRAVAVLTRAYINMRAPMSEAAE